MKNSIDKVGGSAKNKINKTKDTIADNKISAYVKDKFSYVDEISDELTEYLKGQSSKLSSSISLTILSAPELLKVTEVFTKSTATIYDKAMDMEYLKDHVGGGNHRLFDGGHTLWGAWEKVAEASDDDSFFQEVIGYVSGMWKDATTVKGLPFFTTDTESYDHYADWVKD